MRLRARPDRTRGFSLLELLVAIGLFGLFTVTITRLMMGGMQTYQRGQSISTIRSDLRGALDLIAADFRQSNTTITTPSYASGKNRVLTLTFRRYVRNATTGVVSESPITYQIDYASNRLTREDLSTTPSQKILVADNILVGPRPTENDSPNLYRSYFVWAVDPNLSEDSQYKSATMEVRLTGMRYEGKQEQRLTMVTQISQRADFTAGLPPKVSLVSPTDLGRPTLWKALLPAEGSGW